MNKVNVETLKPWISQRITELLGIEDDVLVEFVYNQLEEKVSISSLQEAFIFAFSFISFSLD